MTHRSQDIPIRPRYGYTEEENEQGEHTQRTSSDTPASSYTEIPFLAQYPGAVPDHVLQDITPTAANTNSLPGQDGDDSYVNLDSGEEEDQPEGDDDDSNSKDSSGEPLQMRGKSETNAPYVESGEMRHFVAHNLEEKLREGAGAGTPLDYSSEHTTPSTSMGPGGGEGILTRRFLQSRNIPEVDGNVLSDIELEAQYLATSVDNLLENLGNLLHSISSITADNVEVHKNAVNKLTDTLDANIKCQYQLLAKTEEITKSMKPTERLGQRIREIKRLVDTLDSIM
ncbi:BLOC-1-related complex subunit 6 [Drosophila persimilis]|uniref:BLOC-1-related complex subunit 6 n=1 Tax=Drosophila pseudoobscura pseudoobscura TaxID=46245 RepID=Q29FF3_DROPS|nr:BLOC-1-related complex subunit 6 [Drosophila pseudoobscura]XP_026849555.1 BLOC-1-related complex subunit 6 [Drosophila persimilis]